MDELTAKQADVLRMMSRGMTNGEIAERMGISLSGAKWHVSEVLSKLGVESREEAVQLWKREQSLGRRVSRMAGAVSVPKVAWGGGAVAGVGGIAVVVAMVVGAGGRGGSEALVVGAVAGTPTAGVEEVDKAVFSPGFDEQPAVFQTMEFRDGSIQIAADEKGCVWFDQGGGVLMWTCTSGDGADSSDEQPTVFSQVRPHPATRAVLGIATRPPAAYVEVLDEDGGIHREAVQRIESSPDGLGYAWFDRELPAKPVAYRVIGADGGELATYTYHGILDRAPDNPGPPGTQHTYAGRGTDVTNLFAIKPPYTEGKWIARYEGTDRIVASLECDTGNVTALDAQGPLTGPATSVVVEYPEGATLCAWRAETAGTWSFTAK